MKSKTISNGQLMWSLTFLIFLDVFQQQQKLWTISNIQHMFEICGQNFLHFHVSPATSCVTKHPKHHSIHRSKWSLNCYCLIQQRNRNLTSIKKKNSYFFVSSKKYIIIKLTFKPHGCWLFACFVPPIYLIAKPSNTKVCVLLTIFSLTQQ